MTYLIGQDKPAGKGVQRVLREQNARIIAFLSHWEEDPADSIHCARQACKRARAVAQLLKAAAPCVVGFVSLQPGSAASGYHAWRRQVKYAAHQTQLLANLASTRAMTVGPRLRELSALLGHGQDLELLEMLLRQQPDALRIDTHVERLRQLIAATLAQLRRRALEVGTELFGDATGLLGDSTTAPDRNETVP